MPNCLIRHGWLDSERIDRLSAEAERFFLRLMLNVDDAGRFDGRTAILCARVDPLRRGLSDERVGEWLRACEESGLITVYEWDRKPFLQVLRFQRRGRAVVSKFPDSLGSFRIDYVPRETCDGSKEFVASSLPDCHDVKINGGSHSTRADIPSVSQTDAMQTPSAPHTDAIGTPKRLNVLESPETETETGSESGTSLVPSAPARGGAITWNQDSDWVGITEADRAGWSLAYPAVDLERQLAAAGEWLRSNPTKAHKRNWRRFLTNWLARAQERGGDNNARRVPKSRFANAF